MGTPTRRQPRFSEPGNLDSPFESAQDTKASFIPFASKTATKEDKQEHYFYKKHTYNGPEITKEE